MQTLLGASSLSLMIWVILLLLVQEKETLVTKGNLCSPLRWIRGGQRILRASLEVQMVKNLPAMQETRVWSLAWEDPLEKGMATHSSILAWRIPWTEKPGGLQTIGSQRVRHEWAAEHTHTVGYPADWAAIHFSAFYGLPWNCQGIKGGVIFSITMKA